MSRFLTPTFGSFARMAGGLTICVAALLSLVARTAHAGGASKPTVAILGLEFVDDRDAKSLDPKTVEVAKILTEELRKRPRTGTGPYDLSAGGDRSLAELKLLEGCDNEARECMSDIGAELKTDFLLYGKVKLGHDKSVTLSLMLINVNTKRLVRALGSIDIPPADRNLTGLAIIAKNAYAKITASDIAGTVVVHANVQVGQVFFDSSPKGPLVNGTATFAGVPEGKLNIGVESPGYSRFDDVIPVKGGEDTNIDVKLAAGAAPLPSKAHDGATCKDGSVMVDGACPLATGPKVDDVHPGALYRKLFYGAAAVTVAGTVTWVVSWTKIQDAENVVQPIGCNAGRTDLVAACNQGNNYAHVTWVAAPLTVAAGAVAIYAFYKGFVAPKGSSSENDTAQALRRRHKKQDVAIVPVLSPTGLGATFQIDF